MMELIVSFSIGIPDSKAQQLGGREATLATILRISDVAIRIVARGLAQITESRAQILVGKNAEGAPVFISERRS